MDFISNCVLSKFCWNLNQPSQNKSSLYIENGEKWENYVQLRNLIIRKLKLKYEPRHDKTNKMAVRPAKTRISLGIRPVWSESSLSAQRKLGYLATHWAPSEDSDQTGRMPRLIWVFAGRTLSLLVLSWAGSIISVFFIKGQTFPAQYSSKCFKTMVFPLCLECPFSVVSRTYSHICMVVNYRFPSQHCWLVPTVPKASAGPLDAGTQNTKRC